MDASTWLDRYEFVAARVAPRANGTPHLALCFDCVADTTAMPPPMTWIDDGPRDEWARRHAALTGHTVERYHLCEGTLVESLTAVRPDTARLGHAPGTAG